MKTTSPANLTKDGGGIDGGPEVVRLPRRPQVHLWIDVPWFPPRSPTPWGHPEVISRSRIVARY